MATFALLNYDDALPEAQAVFDDIKATRDIEDVNNFWKAMAIVGMAHQTTGLATGMKVPVDEMFEKHG